MHHREAFLTFLFIIVFSSSYCQSIEWQHVMGGSTDDDEIQSIQQTNDGGYVVAARSVLNDGYVSGNHGSSDYWVVKLDSSGDTLWTRSLGGSDRDNARSIQQTNDSGYILAGWSQSNDGDVSGNHGGRDYWVVKLDSSGDTLWTRSLGGSDRDIAQSIQQTSDGGYIVGGFTRSNDGDVSGNHGERDCWVVKLDSSGDTIWTRSLGGTGFDRANSIQQTSDGGYIVGGDSGSNDGDVSGNHGGEDYWVVKLDSSGDTIWTRSLGGTNNDYANSIDQTSDGGYIVGGQSSSDDGDVFGNHGSSDYWVVKLDSSGDTIWTRSLGGTGYDHAKSIQQTSDGGYIVGGGTRSNDGDVSGDFGERDCWVVKLDSSVNTTGFAQEQIAGVYFQVHPNPASQEVIFRYELPKAMLVQFTLHDIQGQRVKSVVNGRKVRGIHQRQVSLQSLSSGIYFYRLRTNSNVRTGKLVVE